MSKDEREAELILMKERWSLISNGTNRADIRIIGNSIFVNKRRYGSVVNHVFVHASSQQPASQDDARSRTPSASGNASNDSQSHSDTTHDNHNSFLEVVQSGPPPQT